MTFPRNLGQVPIHYDAKKYRPAVHAGQGEQHYVSALPERTDRHAAVSVPGYGLSYEDVPNTPT